jgi:glycosyltransferase involved in cell wall biosynthesis
MAEPGISVLIPVFNGARFLAAALESVAGQTHAALETIVVDDGSTDDSAAVAARFAFARVVRQDNRGPGAARNRAFAEARGEHIAFLDSDDLWRPAKLEHQLAELAARPEQGWLVCHHELLLDEGQPWPRWAPPQTPEMIAWMPSAILTSRECFVRSGGFDETLRYGEDLDWFSRARGAGFSGGVVAESLFQRRVHRTNLMHAYTTADLQIAIAAMVKRRRRPPG